MLLGWEGDREREKKRKRGGAKQEQEITSLTGYG
jgi:hypothetical protein